MRLLERVQYHLLSPFLGKRRQQTLNAQYIQWQREGYSRLVQSEMIILSVLFFIVNKTLQPQYRNKVAVYLHRLSGISPEIYKHYEKRYLDPWDPMYFHVRLLIRFFPKLIPKHRRPAALNLYKIWKNDVNQSPSSVLNTILNHFDSRHVDHNWYLHIRKMIELKIWPRGQIEQPFHLRAYGRWELKDFPDPKCKDPTRYAFAASFMEQLVDVFNWRTELGIRRDYIQTGHEVCAGKRWDGDYPSPTLERVPKWTKRVPAAPKPLVINSACAFDEMSFADVLARHGELNPPNQHFLKRHLIVDKNFLQFI
jgi:hypothetical protein